MPVLSNPRWERYAQNLASGTMTITEAYQAAGFDDHRSNASRLRKRIAVDRRVKEIMAKRDRKITEKLAREQETTREKILDELEQAREIAKKARNGSAMAMASLGKAKVMGLIVDRREVGEVGAFNSMTDEELLAEARKRAEALGLPPPKLDS